MANVLIYSFAISMENPFACQSKVGNDRGIDSVSLHCSTSIDLVDCSWGFGNNGCDGGEDYRAYQYIMKHGGLPLEDSYGPYLQVDSFCHHDSVPKGAKILGFVNVTEGDEEAVRIAIAKKGPVSVGK